MPCAFTLDNHNVSPTRTLQKSCSKSVFDSVVVSAFQITFRAKMHVNDIFLFFKNYFWYQHIKTIQNVQIILNFNKKKISNFLETQPQPQPRSQTLPIIRYCPRFFGIHLHEMRFIDYYYNNKFCSYLR
jgi:hypothetical protein